MHYVISVCAVYICDQNDAERRNQHHLLTAYKAGKNVASGSYFQPKCNQNEFIDITLTGEFACYIEPKNHSGKHGPEITRENIHDG